ncbi:hypothetical protein ACFL1T_04155 [Chlamydiota bacterium]
MKTNRIILVSMLFVALLLILTGCETIQKKYYVKCDWCGTQIISRDYMYDTMNKNVCIATTQYGLFGDTYLQPGEYVGRAETFDEAKRIMQDNALSHAATVEEGHPFCTLKCVNAYKASTGIKEERRRVIYGE